MDEKRRLTALEVSDFLDSPVWRMLAATIEIKRRQDMESLLDRTEERKKKRPDDLLAGEIKKAEELLALPTLLLKRLRALEKNERFEYTDEEQPVDLA